MVKPLSQDRWELTTRSLDPTGKGGARWVTRWKPALTAFAITPSKAASRPMNKPDQIRSTVFQQPVLDWIADRLLDIDLPPIPWPDIELPDLAVRSWLR